MVLSGFTDHCVVCVVSCDPQGQASSKGLEVELLRKKLSAADTNISTLRTDLAEAQQEAAALRAQVQDMESQAGESQVAAEEQVRVSLVMWLCRGVFWWLHHMAEDPGRPAAISNVGCWSWHLRYCCAILCAPPPLLLAQLSDLNRKLLDKEQVLQEYEYERSQMQRRMEELSQRLMDKSSSLEGSRSVSDTGEACRQGDRALLPQARGAVKCEPGPAWVFVEVVEACVVVLCRAGDPSSQVNDPGPVQCSTPAGGGAGRPDRVCASVAGASSQRPAGSGAHTQCSSMTCRRRWQHNQLGVGPAC